MEQEKQTTNSKEERPRLSREYVEWVAKVWKMNMDLNSNKDSD